MFYHVLKAVHMFRTPILNVPALLVVGAAVTYGAV
jgi:hypothetical protein